MPEAEVRRYTRSILEGIKHIHKCDYVHCDLKPENILLVPNPATSTGSFVAKISDFGLARAALEEGKRHISTHVMGTFGYEVL